MRWDISNELIPVSNNQVLSIKAICDYVGVFDLRIGFSIHNTHISIDLRIKNTYGYKRRIPENN